MLKRMFNRITPPSTAFMTLLAAAILLVPTSIASAVSTAASKPTGTFVATSTTAMSVTGDLVITGKRISGSLGIVAAYRSAGSISGSTLITTTGESIASLLVVPAETKINLLVISSETYPSKSANGGFCGTKQKTKYLAVAVSDGKLAIASFNAKPGPKAVAGALCGTYQYERK
jgi:hypothetical protein